MNPKLRLFTDPWTTNRVPRQAFIDLFVRLIPLLPSKYALPNPRPDNDGFPESLASLLAGANELPGEVLKVFAEIEALAAPERQPSEDPVLEIEPEAPEPGRLRNAIWQWLARGTVTVAAAEEAVVAADRQAVPLAGGNGVKDLLTPSFARSASESRPTLSSVGGEGEARGGSGGVAGALHHGPEDSCSAVVSEPEPVSPLPLGHRAGLRTGRSLPVWRGWLLPSMTACARRKRRTSACA